MGRVDEIHLPGATLQRGPGGIIDAKLSDAVSESRVGAVTGEAGAYVSNRNLKKQIPQCMKPKKTDHLKHKMRR